LIGSLFYVRFWCRYLCPAGAFLSLLNHVRVLRRCVPAKRFGACEFGLTATDHLDCICCDRCRHPVREVTMPGGRATVHPLASPVVLSAAIIGLFVAGLCLEEFGRVMPLIIEEPVATTAAGGQSRDVDVQQIQTLIEQDRLADHEALFYRKIESDAPGPPSAAEAVDEPR
jgi:hypothetical protein